MSWGIDFKWKNGKLSGNLSNSTLNYIMDYVRLIIFIDLSLNLY